MSILKKNVAHCMNAGSDGLPLVGRMLLQRVGSSAKNRSSVALFRSRRARRLYSLCTEVLPGSFQHPLFATRQICDLSSKVLWQMIRQLMIVSLSTCLGCSNPKHAALRTSLLKQEMVLVPGGKFTMGHYVGGTPPHGVLIKPFRISNLEVTNTAYEQFRKHARGEYSTGDLDPVTDVSFWDAIEYAKWLTARTHQHYRLPSEAEWEYAARGGLHQMDYSWGNDPPDGRCLFGGQHVMPVGSYAPNAYGLYDMTGNVGEWVQDQYIKPYPTSKGGQAALGSEKASMGVVRGMGVGVFDVQIWLRIASDRTERTSSTGFRLALD